MQALEELIVWRTDNPVRFAEELGHLTKLRKLTMVEFEPVYNGERELELLSSSLSELGKCNLRYLTTDGYICEHLFRDPSCTTYPHLQHLDIIDIKRVPKGMASLKNVVKLCMSVDIFDEEGLHLLMGMSSLEHLALGTKGDVKERLVIGGNGFKRLKAFVIRLDIGFLVTPGAMPALQRLYLQLHASNVAGYCGDVDFGFEHLSALAHLEVDINCLWATEGEVEAVEALVEKAIGRHPIRHALNAHVRRYQEEFMMSKEAHGRVYQEVSSLARTPSEQE